MHTRGGAIRWILRGPGAVALGAVAGVTWMAALRAYMIEIAGWESRFSWWGTFGAILVPGALTGALVAVSWLRARQGRASAWFAFAVAPLAVVPLFAPGALITLFTTGLGGGAVGVALFGLAGGFALGARGPVWVRWIIGVLWVLGTAGLALAPTFTPDLAVTTPEGAWVVVLATGLMLLFGVACAGPFVRRRTDSTTPATEWDERALDRSGGA